MKLLVLVCSSLQAVFKPSFVLNSLAINQNINKNKCLTKRQVLFIKIHYFDVQYLFWSNLGSSHYVRSVINLLDNKINFVEKKEMKNN